MASSPTYQPSLFVGKVDRAKLAPLLDAAAAKRANTPGLNRAIAGVYPPGSTFKPVTALAGMEEHVFSAYSPLQCSPVAYYGLDRQKFTNWNPYVDQPMTLPEALAQSCDTYFDEIGDRFYQRGPEGRVRLQQWARRFGFGEPVAAPRTPSLTEVTGAVAPGRPAGSCNPTRCRTRRTPSPRARSPS